MLASDLIKELEKAIAVIGDVGVYVFEGETLEVKVEVLEESDMIVIRNKTQEEKKLEATENKMLCVMGNGNPVNWAALMQAVQHKGAE